MKKKFTPFIMVVIALMSACTQEKSLDPDQPAPDNTILKYPCPQATVPYTDLAAFSSSPQGFCSGQLKEVWDQCYGGMAPPVCKPGQTPVTTDVFINCETLENIIGGGGAWPGYPNVTYAQQRTIIDWAIAQANASPSRPTCANGQAGRLYYLGFCRDTNIPNGICIRAKFYCCV